MAWTFEQWRTWPGDREKLAKRLKDCGYEVVGWVNGRPRFAKEVNRHEIEAMAQGLDQIAADFPEVAEEEDLDSGLRRNDGEEDEVATETEEPEKAPEVEEKEPEPKPKRKTKAKKRSGKKSRKKGGNA